MDDTSASTVEVNFTLGIGSGTLETSLNVPAGDVSLTDFLPVLQTFTSHVVGSAIQATEQAGLRISCKAGCGACCRQLVTLSIFEAEYLAKWIRSLPAERQKELEQRFATAVDHLRESGMLARMASADWQSEARQISLEYLAERVPCPFLEHESCGIHPIRPLICREYLVTSPAEFCSLQPTELVVGVPVPLKLSRELYKIGAQVTGDNRGWIPLSLLFVWMGMGATPGDAVHGTGPAMLYEFVKRLATAGPPA